MILYKYVSFQIGKKILETNSIAFSKATTFNDPFDRPRYPIGESVPATTAIAAEVYARGRLRFMQMEHDWVENTGMLCLTRTPTNPLMWAHYADNHTAARTQE